MIKLMNSRRNEGKLQDLTKLIPAVTHDEHIQRVVEWTQRSQPAPPSNKRKSSRQARNEDLEAKSRLVSEALKLMDNRDEQIRSRPGTAVDGEPNAQTEGKQPPKTVEDDQISQISKHFQDSRMSARAYVYEFEKKMKKKNDLAAAILNVYPVGKARKNFRSKMMVQMGNAGNFPPTEPEAWKPKMSRSVRFSMKPPSVAQTIPSSAMDMDNEGTDNPGPMLGDKVQVDDRKWVMKHENDRDWWKWKLKQRFMQNDELLHKLASQRQKLETSLNIGGMRKKRLSVQSSNNSSVTTLPLMTKKSSSRHIMLEIAPSKPGPILKSREIVDMNPPSKVKDPMPNFYAPSKQYLNMIKVHGGVKSSSTTAVSKQKLKTLRKDPYLAKLLTGNEQFKPEMMLDASQANRKHELSQQFKDSIAFSNTNANAVANTNVKRKLSLETLDDSTDDDFTAQKFFNPDVKVLYERMSEMDTGANTKRKSKLMALASREPSDGFLNLPLLLATGRFNRYNKLPKVKGFTEATSSKQRRSEKIYRTKSQSHGNKKRMSSMPPRMGAVGVVQAAAAALASKDDSKSNPLAGKRIEEMTTKEWAKQIMLKMKPQNTATSNKTDTDDSFVTLSEDDDDEIVKEKNDTRLLNVDDSQDSSKDPKKKYKVPTDQETNLLYHEILMSKWKKEKHDKNKDLTTAGGNPKTKTKWKRGSGGKKMEKMNDNLFNSNKPRGLDIWLENIREKAKRDRLIAPQPNFDESKENFPNKTTSSQPLVTTFNNAAFDATD